MSRLDDVLGPELNRLFCDIHRPVNPCDDEQRAGESLPPSREPSANAREATPTPHLHGHEGVEL
ncbi:MAG TPA: hypothetical protein VIT90_15235 [Lysobacter sp.]